MMISQETDREDRKGKKAKTFTKRMQERLAVAVIVITLALFALIALIYHIIRNNKEDYNQIVLSQQEYDSRVIPYKRGDIVDRNGTSLAISEQVYNLIIDPKQIMAKKEDYFSPTVSALSTVFGYDMTELENMITEKKDTAYVRYARQLTLDEKQQFETLQKDTNTANSKSGSSERIKGVWFEDEYKRIYPYNSLACNVIGFARSDGSEGTGGIEQYYNNNLIGTNGREYGYLNDDSNLERVIKPSVNGNTIVSTIDVNIQSIVEKYINQWQTESGSNITGVVVMNPQNGEVLAMATSNTYDLNDPRNLSGYYSEEEIAAMDEQAKSDAWNKLWRNFCVSDTYEPGSPSKVFTVAAGLEEGVLSPNDTFVCDGYQEVGGWRIRCVNRNGHGTLTTEEALMVSCNDALMQMAARMGKENFAKYQRIFGFGSKTGIDLPGEAETSTLINSPDTMTSSDLATNSFGQNYNCTMLQMAAAYCSIINGGSYYEPHVVKQVLNEKGSVVEKIDPNLVRETASETTCSFIREALFHTVSKGTGKAAAVAGYEVGGKTGTAEKYPRGTGNYLVSFAGFAPVEKPEVFIYVIIDVPHVADQPHSSYASGIFQKIMTDVLPYMNVFPTTETEDNSQAEALLPDNEGITDNIPSETETAPEESKVYATDEYIEPQDPENGGSIDAEQIPGVPAGGGEIEIQSENLSEDATKAEE